MSRGDGREAMMTMRRRRRGGGDGEREVSAEEERKEEEEEEEEEAVIQMKVRTSLSCAALVHLMTELICFLLYMHQQMPCTYEQLQLHSLERTEAHISGGSIPECETQRRSRGRDRRELSGVKKLVKLKSQIEKLLLAFQSGVLVLADICSVLVLLGPTPTRPKHTYEVHLHCGLTGSVEITPGKPKDQAPKMPDLSRKLIRALISDGPACSSEGATKLFLMIRASATSGVVPEDFLPKRGFILRRKKVVRTSIQITQDLKTSVEDTVGSISMSDCTPTASTGKQRWFGQSDDDCVWFQCKHSVKGLTGENSEELH